MRNVRHLKRLSFAHLLCVCVPFSLAACGCEGNFLKLCTLERIHKNGKYVLRAIISDNSFVRRNETKVEENKWNNSPSMLLQTFVFIEYVALRLLTDNLILARFEKQRESVCVHMYATIGCAAVCRFSFRSHRNGSYAILIKSMSYTECTTMLATTANTTLPSTKHFRCGKIIDEVFTCNCIYC